MREAIQILSGEVSRHRALAHLGWRREESGYVFVHAGGVIGHVGQKIEQYRADDVYLPQELRGYCLPELPSTSILQNVVRLSKEMILLAPDIITFPLFAAIYRAPLGMVDFFIHFSGPTGVGKSELVALAQQHCGAAMDARHLPASWSSTANALELLLYYAKDSIIVVDDFCPIGCSSDIQRFHRDADRVLRAQGNNSGRTRMTVEANLRRTRYPRGLVISTGEEVFRGQSLLARGLNLELSPGQLNFGMLGVAQEQAAAGVYAQAYVGYLSWLSKRMEGIHKSLQQEKAQLRIKAARSNQHRRTPDVVANLALGLQAFLEFAYEIKAIDEQERGRLWNRGWEALCAAGAAQEKFQVSSEPTQRFLALLRSGIASGNAHIASEAGEAPAEKESYGWRRNIVGIGDGMREEWRPQGKRIGWAAGDNLYLDPDASYTLAQEISRSTGEGIKVGSATLHKRLQQNGLLRTYEEERGLTTRVTLEGKRRPVLHLFVTDLWEPAQSAQSTRSTTYNSDSEDEQYSKTRSP